MLFSQLAHADSLREICNGLACCEGKLVRVELWKAILVTPAATLQQAPAAAAHSAVR
jgi:hypothetical protein